MEVERTSAEHGGDPGTTAAPRPRLFLITGIMASGKSTLAQGLAERLPKSVHLRGDAFRRMIVNGRAELIAPLSDAARAQLDLRYRLAAAAAKSYLAAGFSVVYQDIILGEDLSRVLSYHSYMPLHVVVLCPRAEVVARRARDRSKPGYTAALGVDELDRALRTVTPRIGLWLDNSDQDVAESVDLILGRLHDAAIGEAVPVSPSPSEHLQLDS